MTTNKVIDMTTDAAHADNIDLFLTFHGDTVDLLRRTPDDAQTS